MFCTQASCDFNAAANTLHSVRLENVALSRQPALANAAIATHAESMAQLGLRVKNAEADSAAAMRTIRKDRERFKAGMVAYTEQMAKLRSYMLEYKPGYGGYADLEVNGRVAANAGLQRANSILRQHSANHGLNTDALVLASVGIAADNIDWNLLGLSPPRVTVEPPPTSSGRSSGESSDNEASDSAQQALFKRFEWRKVPGYIIAQTLGAFVAALVLYIVYYPWLDIVDPEREFTQGIFATYPNDLVVLR
ncbi:Aquaporin [Phytophthora palmivora]|uniref:Aquaporin n=1 Tax=Phytophthora palmivora TaxID=4796 RepID=A0A2P4YGT4_9STRA|nr:Aquaporin [Phytophthora palmivora]